MCIVVGTWNSVWYIVSTCKVWAINISTVSRHSSRSSTISISSTKQSTGCIRISEGAGSGRPPVWINITLIISPDSFTDGKTRGMFDTSFGLIFDFTGLQGKYLV